MDSKTMLDLLLKGGAVAILSYMLVIVYQDLGKSRQVTESLLISNTQVMSDFAHQAEAQKEATRDLSSAIRSLEAEIRR